MVSKSNLHRQRPLIFITVGTSAYPFTRLPEILEIIRRLGEYEIIVQSGKMSVADTPHLSHFAFLSPQQMEDHIARADYIICHCAAATIHQIIQLGKVDPLVIPRLHSLGEHVNDHQLQLARYFRRALPTHGKNLMVTSSNCEIAVKKYLTTKATTMFKTSLFQEEKLQNLDKLLI